jgi:hypothetical protein
MTAHAGEQPSELHRRRDALAAEVAELHWNLGGLTYEMAIRDHFRIDVLVRRAAMLQEREAELAEVERLLHMREGSIVGTCASCGAVRSRGAVFCWQCGAQVMERRVASPGAGADAAVAFDSAAASLAGTSADTVSGASAEQGAALAMGGEGLRATARPVVAPAVSHETDAASRGVTHGDELGVGRPVPIP